MAQLQRTGIQVVSADGRPLQMYAVGGGRAGPHIAANPMFAAQQQQAAQQHPQAPTVAGYPAPGAAGAHAGNASGTCDPELTRWLENNDVAASEKQLAAAGVCTLAQVAAMSEEQVVGLGLLPVMRERLLAALRALPGRAA